MNLTHAIWRRSLGLAFAAVATSALGVAQQPAPVPPSGPPAQPAAVVQLPTYRPPALALVQPAAGGSVPQDRPVVVFRFAPGEPNDPIDARSFGVAVDGADRAAAFQVTTSEAWGSIADAGDGAFVAGAHQVTARICSARGACAEVTVPVTVIPSAAVSRPSADSSAKTALSRRRRVIDALVAAVKHLLSP